MRLIVLCSFVLGALVGCHRLNSRYCDDATPCAAGLRCGPLNECVSAEAPDASGDVLMSTDSRPADALMVADLAPNACGGTCSCRAGATAGCSCRQLDNCTLTCDNDCPEVLDCRMITNCEMRCGARCNATCTQSAACKFTVGTDSSVTCTQAGCSVTCLGACKVTCTQCSSAVVTCMGGVLPTPCPGGVQVCGRACP